MEETDKTLSVDFPMKLNIAMRQVPLKALDEEAREIVCTGLNQNTVKTGNGGVTRNYRGLAELTRCFEYDEIEELAQDSNPTGRLLALWQEFPAVTIGKLLDLLLAMERHDIFEDLTPRLITSGRKFLRFLSEEESPSPETKESEEMAKKFGLVFLSRPSWNAFRSLKYIRLMVSPVRVVFIHHTAFLLPDLHDTVKSLQSCKVIYYGHHDIDYNFLIGNDGTVFEGRGWDHGGSHTRGYNYVSISIGLLGNYEENIPDSLMLEAASKLIEFGVQLGKIHTDHGIYPHCDATPTLSPGRHILAAISSWPRFRHLGALPTPEALKEVGCGNSDVS